MAKLVNESPRNPAADFLGVGPQLEGESNRDYGRRIDKAYMKKYDLVWCPDCDGDGYYDVIDWISYNGNVTTKQHTCNTCNGQRWVDRETEKRFEEENPE